jgi:LppX_LprAFG lipoprotein
MRLRPATATATVLAALSLSLTACGSDDTAGSASSSGDSSASSSQSSSAGPSATGSGHLDEAGVVKALTIGQQKGKSAHMEMKLGGAATLSAKGDVDYRSATPETRLTMTSAQLGGGTIEVRIVKGIVYLHIPKATPNGKFLRIDPEDTSSAMGKSFGSLSKQLDPLSSFRAMKSAVRTVTYVGQDTVDGTETGHYKVTVDSATLFKALGQKTLPQVPRSVVYDVWFDSSDLLRRMRTQLAGERTEVTLSDWGKPVTVQAPPTSKQVSGFSAAS